MKLLFAFILLLQGSLMAQVKDSISAQVLYIDYENTVQIPLPVMESVNSVACQNCVLAGSNGLYKVKPNEGSSATISTINEAGDTLTRIMYKVKPLPVPQIYWGENPSGTSIPEKSQVLSASYEDDVDLNVQFEVVNWQLEVDDYRTNGYGYLLSSDVQTLIDTLPEGTEVKITCHVEIIGRDQLITIEGVWYR